MIKDYHEIVLLISFKFFRDFYNVLNINDNVLFIDCIFSCILICFQLSHKFEIIKFKSFDKCLTL